MNSCECALVIVELVVVRLGSLENRSSLGQNLVNDHLLINSLLGGKLLDALLKLSEGDLSDGGAALDLVKYQIHIGRCQLLV